MTLIIDCPSCQRKLRVPDDLLGLKVKCPSCATMFTASDSSSAAAAAPPPPPPEPAAPPPAESAPAPSWPVPAVSEPSGPATAPPPGAISDPEPAPPRPAKSDRRPCPSCRESIPVEATRCRYCGEPVERDPDDDDRPWERTPYQANVRRDSEPHRGTMVLVFGILSIVLGMSYFVSLVALPMGIAAWVMGQRDLRRMRMNEMDPQGEGSTQAGWICGIIGTVISSFLSLCCVAQILYIVFIAVAVAAAPKGNPGRPTTRPPNRFSAPAEILPLRVPVLPREMTNAR